MGETIIVHDAKELFPQAVLKDSGERRDFGTGAVRDMAKGKGRCDLLPLEVVGVLLHGALASTLNMLYPLRLYLTSSEKDSVHLLDAMHNFAEERKWTTYDAIFAMAQQLEDGAVKYGDRNWENGIPIVCFIDSAIRHYIKWHRGDTDEPHDRAVVWNLLAAVWTFKNRPEMIDAPYYGGAKTEEA